MPEKMVNGILFIIAGIGSIAIYMVLGETGLLGKVHTEKIAAYALVTIPLAFMMTRNVARNPFIDTGLLIIVIGLTMGLVGDAINSTKISAESDLIAEAVGMTAWSIMYLGYFITGIGYLRTNLFPKWLSGLLSVVSLVTFASIAISSPEFLSTNGENIVIPLWMINSIVLVILGIFTMRRA